jgi:hypothetical protein
VLFAKVLCRHLAACEDLVSAHLDVEIEEPLADGLGGVCAVVGEDEELPPLPPEGLYSPGPSDFDPALLPLIEDPVEVEEEELLAFEEPLQAVTSPRVAFTSTL